MTDNYISACKVFQFRYRSHLMYTTFLAGKQGKSNKFFYLFSYHFSFSYFSTVPLTRCHAYVVHYEGDKVFNPLRGKMIFHLFCSQSPHHTVRLSPSLIHATRPLHLPFLSCSFFFLLRSNSHHR